MPRLVNQLLQQPTFTFYGAADSVSGSMHLVDTGRSRVLLDCGKSFGQEESKSHSGRDLFPFSPAEVDLVLISHAHIDHCGSLPLLVKNGFRGNILCTHATLELLEIVLYDVARVHEREWERARFYSGSRRGRGAHRGGGDQRVLDESHFISYDDVDATLRLFQGVDYDERLQPLADIKICMRNSAHVLGSSMIEMDLRGGESGPRKLVFTGDLGRFDFPYIGTPVSIPDADLIVCESTYGNRLHEPFDATLNKLAELINQTIEAGGKALIPAFSLGRTNFLKCSLLELRQSGRIPNVPICIDSPLASQFDYVYRDFGNDGLNKNSDTAQPTDGIEWLESSDEAWWRTTSKEPCVIVASGGMCEGGRILDHLRCHIDDPRTCLILVSYQAPDSLGAELLSNRPVVKLQGRFWNKWIRVEQIQGFSAHGDQKDLVRLLDTVNRERKICLVHGEAEAKLTLQELLTQEGYANVTIPSLFDEVGI
ncbi:MBL fold metallo-hydrolase RNA specificity domain-containing protein [Pirellulaceae bacterium SH449]